MVEQGVKLANDLPSYTRDLNEAFEENPQLQELNKDYDITKKLEEAAENLVSRLGQAAGALADIGAGVVSSVFALVTILVMSMFIINRGARWRDAALAYRPAHQAERLRRASDHIADAVGSYIAARSSRPSSPAWPPSSCSRSSVCPHRCRSRWSSPCST